MHLDSMQRLVGLALSSGGERESAMVTAWNVSGRCLFPQVRELHVRPSAERKGKKISDFLASIKEAFPGAEVVRRDYLPEGLGAPKYVRVHAGASVPVHERTAVPLTLRLTVPCRKCDKCLRRRAAIWSNRARAEWQVAARSWFGTLTLRPAEHDRIYWYARKRLVGQGLDFDALPFGEQFAERHNLISVELTKYLKRVRKHALAPFRYLMVAEHHQSGLPHYHLLLHEGVEGSVKHAVLSEQWKLGFEQWRLASDAKTASYLCKYLAKASVARVRASRAYGEILKYETTPKG